MQLTKKKGFTLIEIVIVLAIAALILIIVFLAVSGAQRERRNDGRKNIAGQVVAAVQTFQGNNGGALPTNASPSTQLQSIVINRDVPGVGTMTINVSALPSCTNTGSAIVTFNGSTTVRACLEGNGTTGYDLTL